MVECQTVKNGENIRNNIQCRLKYCQVQEDEDFLVKVLCFTSTRVSYSGVV